MKDLSYYIYLLYFLTFQIWPQAHFNEHDDGTELSGYSITIGSFLRAIHRCKAGHGLRVCFRGICSLCPVRGAGGRKVGDYRRSVQLLLVASRIPYSHSLVFAHA